METRHVKTQDVRWIDVFFLGPFMVWYAAKARGMPEWARGVMAISGILTIAYNGANYFAYRRTLQEDEAVADLDSDAS